MKNIITTLVLLLSVNAFALNSKSSWKEITDAHMQIDGDEVHFFDQYWGSVLTSCLEEGNIRTNQTRFVCDEYAYVTPPRGKRSDGETVCLGGHLQYLKTPVRGYQEVCEYEFVGRGDNKQLECVGKKNVYRELATTRKLEVYRMSGGDSDRKRNRFYKYYTIPKCK